MAEATDIQALMDQLKKRNPEAYRHILGLIRACLALLK